MNRNHLIDSILRQTMVLTAQLATASGRRTPLAHVANQVFLDLATELRGAGVGHKVIADMFGMALRTYHDRVRRLSESATDRGKTLWEAVLEHLREQPAPIYRADVLLRFRRDDPLVVRSVLSDLVDSGLAYRAGRGDRTTYRAAEPEEAEVVLRDDDEVRATFVWVTVHRYAPCTYEDLAKMLVLSEEELAEALRPLLSDGRVTVSTGPDGVERLECSSYLIDYEDELGWEAAVFDHFQAMVTAIGQKLHLGPRAGREDRVGGSTYQFDLCPDHPLEERVMSLLREMRQVASSLRSEVEAHNASAGVEPTRRVMFYVGQSSPLDDDPPED